MKNNKNKEITKYSRLKRVINKWLRNEQKTIKPLKNIKIATKISFNSLSKTMVL